jgi:hypothetical protein
METGENIRETNINTAHNEANIINSAVDAKEISISDANDIIYEDLLPEILHTKMFVELPEERLNSMGKTQGEALRDLLYEKGADDKYVIDKLAENNVSLAIAMQKGFHQDTLMANSLKELNERGIKPTLWLVLDDTLGYWTNKANVEESLNKLEKMILWSKENNIEIDGVGLDYEPPIELLKGLMNLNIPETIKETYRYIQQGIKNHRRLGNLQEHIDNKLRTIIDRYNISIETYAAMEPLRSLSNWISFQPHKTSNTVSMAYTSVHKRNIYESELDNSRFKRNVSRTLSKIKDGEIPALGIVGSDPFNTPGKDLRESKSGEKQPEKHLT